MDLYDVWQCSNGLSNPPNHAPKRIGVALPLARARLLASSTSHDRLDRPCAVEQHDPSPVPTCPLFTAESWVNGQYMFTKGWCKGLSGRIIKVTPAMSQKLADARVRQFGH